MDDASDEEVGGASKLTIGVPPRTPSRDDDPLLEGILSPGGTIDGQEIKTSSLPRVIWRLRYFLTFILLEMIAVVMVGPIMPQIAEKYFMRHIHDPPDCSSDHKTQSEKDTCNNADADAGLATTVVNATSSVISFFLLPTVGKLSDMYGRKLFYLIGVATSLVPVLFLNLYWFFDVPLLYYYLGNGVSSSLSSIAIVLAAVADILVPTDRVIGFGMVLASVALGLLIGPVVGGVLSISVTLVTSGVLTALALVVAIVTPETLTEDLRVSYDGRCINPIANLGILFRTQLFRRLTALVIFFSVGEGSFIVLLVYLLKDVFDFGQFELATVLFLGGFGGIISQAFVLKPLQAAIGLRKSLIVGLVCAALFGLSLGFIGQFAPSQGWIVFIAVFIFLSGSLICFPIVSSIKSTCVEESEQGAIQGALYGVRTLAQGIGPLGVAATYKATSSKAPSAAFMLIAVLNFIGVVIAFYLPDPTRYMVRKARQVEKQRLSRENSLAKPINYDHKPALALDSHLLDVDVEDRDHEDSLAIGGAGPHAH